MLRSSRTTKNLLLSSSNSSFRSLFTLNARFGSFDHKDIQEKWQKNWEGTNIPTSTKLDDNTKEKYYCLSQFPYPSGNLHMGHARVYFITDTIAKFESLQGKSVFNPMGWDAFGLPAENAALERNIQPSVWTKQNISDTKRALMQLGVEFDWDHEISTCDPSYYQWTQWIFKQLYNNGYAYKKPGLVNWDPVDNTVLANEQIDENGRSWRSEAIVEKRNLDQWFFAITKLAKKLSSDLDTLKDWPDTVKEMQRGWIGYSEGANLKFDVMDADTGANLNESIEVYTTRLDTIYGCTFLALSYEHPLAAQLANEQEKRDVDKKMKEISKMSELNKKKLGKQKEGLRLTKAVAVNPFSGKRIPIYLTNYVLANYGTGAVMGVPAHDERDAEFANLYNIDIIEVIEPKGDAKAGQKQEYVLKNSDQYNGWTISEATEKLLEAVQTKNKGTVSTNYSIKDWSVSRQRYWGAPFPMVKCDSCGWVPEKDENLPLVLPTSLSNLADLRHVSPLSKIPEFVETTCPKCNHKSTREYDTMDTFVDSSWYYLRYLDPHNDKEFCRRARLQKWLPVDVYIGGIEHAILHLLYARFVHKSLYELGLIPDAPEPFKQLITQGMVKGKTYKLRSNGKYLFPEERGNYSPEEMNVQYDKMSKSKGNGVHPVEIVEKYGSDCLRIAMFFYGPSEKDILWEESLLKTIDGFLEKLYQFTNSVISEIEKTATPQQININEYLADLNKPENQDKKDFLLSILEPINTLEFSLRRTERHIHVAVARFMETINFLNEKRNEFSKYQLEAFLSIRLILLNIFPLAPFLSSELWSRLQKFESMNFKEVQYFGDLEKVLKQQKIVPPKEIINVIRKDQAHIKISIFVNSKAKGELDIPINIIDNEEELLQFVQKQQIKGLEKGVSKVIKPKGKNLFNFITKNA